MFLKLFEELSRWEMTDNYAFNNGFGNFAMIWSKVEIVKDNLDKSSLLFYY